MVADQSNGLDGDYGDVLRPVTAAVEALVPSGTAMFRAVERAMAARDAAAVANLIKEIEAARREILSLLGAFIAVHGRSPADPFIVPNFEIGLKRLKRLSESQGEDR